MALLRKLFTAPLTRASFDYRFGSWAAYFGALLVLILGIVKIASLPLNEFQLFVGLLAIVGVMLVAICGGLLLEVLRRLEAEASKRD